MIFDSLIIPPYSNESSQIQTNLCVCVRIVTLLATHAIDVRVAMLSHGSNFCQCHLPIVRLPAFRQRFNVANITSSALLRLRRRRWFRHFSSYGNRANFRSTAAAYFRRLSVCRCTVIRTEKTSVFLKVTSNKYQTSKTNTNPVWPTMLDGK